MDKDRAIPILRAGGCVRASTFTASSRAVVILSLIR